jgi:hypothetical protein
MSAKPDVAAAMEAIIEKHRCRDSSCMFGPPKGQATNGGCRCANTSAVDTWRKLVLLAGDIRRARDEATR